MDSTAKPTFILCVGEQVIDLPGTLASGYAVKMGGAPGNVAIGLQHLEVPSGIFAQVGQDPFGDFIHAQFKAWGVDTRYLLVDPNAPTSLAFITNDESGSPSFLFYPGAHNALNAENLTEVGLDLSPYTAIHFTSVLQGTADSAGMIDRLIQMARDKQVLLSCDVNMRPALWDFADQTLERIRCTIPKVQILKMTADELMDATATRGNVNVMVDSIWGGELQLVVITLGQDGAFWRTTTGSGYVPALDVDVADTTGAGDAFCAALLQWLSPYVVNGRLEGVSDDFVRQGVTRACVNASISTKFVGAVDGLITLEQLNMYEDHWLGLNG